MAENFNEGLRWAKEKSPEKMAAFHGLLKEIKKEGVLSEETKELIFVALSVKAQCEYCIDYHVKQAISMGLSEDEILEAAWVAVGMGGGPSLAYMGLVKKALKG